MALDYLQSHTTKKYNVGMPVQTPAYMHTTVHAYTHENSTRVVFDSLQSQTTEKYYAGMHMLTYECAHNNFFMEIHSIIQVNANQDSRNMSCGINYT